MIGLDVTAQCNGNLGDSPSDLALFEQYGLIGLVETSTGQYVHLCIGAPFKAGDVGTAFPDIFENGGTQYVFFRNPNCTGQTYLLTRIAPNSRSFRFDPVGDPITPPYGGGFGRLMGKKRVAIIPIDLRRRDFSKNIFAITGEVELLPPGQQFTLDVNDRCVRFGNDVGSLPVVPVFPNDPSITGLPDAPQTPYTLVNVQ